MIDDRGSICNIYVMLIRARLSCHTALSVCIRRPLSMLATVVNDNLRIALRQKSFFSRDNETTLHKLIQMLLKTPTIVSIPNSLAKRRKVLIQVLSYDHWFCTESFSSPVQTWYDTVIGELFVRISSVCGKQTLKDFAPFYFN